MSFADPQTVTISGTTVPLPRVSVGANTATYTSGDGLISMNASNAYGRRIRRVLRLDHRKLSPSPYVPTENIDVSMSNYIVFDVPKIGYTPAEALAVYQGFKTQFTASTDALIVKLLAGES